MICWIPRFLRKGSRWKSITKPKIEYSTIAQYSCIRVMLPFFLILITCLFKFNLSNLIIDEHISDHLIKYLEADEPMLFQNAAVKNGARLKMGLISSPLIDQHNHVFRDKRSIEKSDTDDTDEDLVEDDELSGPQQRTLGSYPYVRDPNDRTNIVKFSDVRAADYGGYKNNNNNQTNPTTTVSANGTKQNSSLPGPVDEDIRKLFKAGTIYQTDIKYNDHYYTTIRRKQPLNFKKENQRKREKLLQTGPQIPSHKGSSGGGTLRHPKTQKLNIKIFDQDYNFSLVRNDNLLGPNFMYAIRNGTHVKTLPIRVPNCYYRAGSASSVNSPMDKQHKRSISSFSINSLGEHTGPNGTATKSSATQSSSLAALSTCGGEVKGYLKSEDGSHYYIHPVSPKTLHRAKRDILKSFESTNVANSALLKGGYNVIIVNRTDEDQILQRKKKLSVKKLKNFLKIAQNPHIIIPLRRIIEGGLIGDEGENEFCPMDGLHYTHNDIIDPLMFHRNWLARKMRSEKVVLNTHTSTQLRNQSGKVKKTPVRDEGELRSNRIRRAPPVNEINTDATVEIGLFYDEDLYMQTNMADNREEKIMDYVLNIMNAVGLLLTHPSLGKSLDVSLVRLEIFEKQPDSLRTKDATALLEAFREFQMDTSPTHEYSNGKNWDNAILLTGIIGLAGIGTMCHNKFSASIIEAKGYRSAYSIAHEMGHNFGMVHDGVSYASRCENEGFIMSPHTGMGTNKWSECSREIISDTLKYFTCLYETSATPWKLSFPVQNVLPGQRISADQQCEAFVGKGSRRFKGTHIESICYYLWCTQPHNDYFAYGTHPALDGTYCGWNKWCTGGRCQPWPYNHGSEVINGGWTDWEADMGCTYNCMEDGSGVYIWTRKCTNPAPLNGGEDCFGEKVAYELCFPDSKILERCEKATVQEYIDDVCRKKSTRTTPYIGGSQYSHNSKVPSHACHVYCQRADTGEFVPSGLIPDGSLCHLDENDVSYYCVHGMCNKPISGAHELPY